jgi:hypothetical protein
MSAIAWSESGLSGSQSIDFTMLWMLGDPDKRKGRWVP